MSGNDPNGHPIRGRVLSSRKFRKAKLRIISTIPAHRNLLRSSPLGPWHLSVKRTPVALPPLKGALHEWFHVFHRRNRPQRAFGRFDCRCFVPVEAASVGASFISGQARVAEWYTSSYYAPAYCGPRYPHCSPRPSVLSRLSLWLVIAGGLPLRARRGRCERVACIEVASTKVTPCL
jgi:hypothetical protein